MAFTNTIIFVLCPAHSGSTLLGYHLGAKPDVTNLGEFSYVDVLGRFNKRGYRSEVQRRGECALCGNNCAYWQKYFQIVQPPQFHAAAFRVFGTNMLVDTSKKLRWCMFTEEAARAQVKYYRVTRDARYRWRKTCLKPGGLTEKRIQNWVRKEKEITRFLRDRESQSIKYEDLCQWAIGYELKEQHALGGDANARSLMQMAHGKVVENAAFRPGLRVHELNKKQMRLLKNCGALELNRELGYGD